MLAEEIEKEVQLLAGGDHRIDQRRESGVGEVVRQCAQISVQQLHLPRRFVGGLAQGPDETADNHPVDLIAAKPSRTRQPLGDESGHRRLPGPRHPRHDQTVRRLSSDHAAIVSASLMARNDIL